MAGFPSDDTTSLNLKRDFDTFLSGRARKPSNLSNRGLHFSLNELDASSLPKEQYSSMSMQSLLEHDRKEKMRESEIISSKTHIAELESKIAKLETSNKKARIEFERDIGTIKHKSQVEIAKLREYKEKWQYLMDREEEARGQLAEARKEVEACKTSYEQKISTLQRDKLQLEEDLHQSHEAMRVKVMEMKNELWRQKTELEICKNELEETNAQLKLQLKRSTEITTQMKELEEYKLRTLDAESKKRELEQKLQKFEDDSVLVKSMKSQLSRVPELEKEVHSLTEKCEFLKETEENVTLLKEQMEGLQSRLHRADQRCAELDRLQVENEMLKKKIKKWELSDSEQMSPVEMKRRLAESQKSHLLLLETRGQLQSKICSLEDELRTKEEQHRSDNSSLFQKTCRSQQQDDLIRRLQKKLLLISKERDALKRILDSYESEMTVNLDSHTGSRQQQMDEVILGYQRQIEQYEGDLQRTGEQLTQEKTRAQQLEQRLKELTCSSSHSQADETTVKTIRELRVTIAELESKLETVEEQKFVLESRIEQRHLQGDFDPMNTKVVHFRMNPAAVAQKQRAEELKTVKEENIKLKERVKILEETGGQVQDLTMVVDKNVQDKQGLSVEELKAQLSSAELKTKRLMEAFKEKSQQLREIIYEVVGYKIDMCNTNQYRLTNRYAESPNDWLLFMQSSSGEVQMLETEYSCTLKSLMEVYLEKQDSIPGLLSAITLELLSQQTMKQ